MKTDNRTGWFEDDGEWFLYHKGKVLGEFWITEHSDPPKMMYSIEALGDMVKEITLPFGNVDEAKAVIENMIISYCAERVAEWSEMRYEMVKIAGERVNEDVRN